MSSQLQEQFERAIQSALPAEQTASAPELATMLADVISGQRSASAAQSQLADSPDLRALIAALAGRRFADQGAQVSFGAGSQIGDVTISDVAGRDIIKLTVHVAAPRRGPVIAALALVALATITIAALLVWQQIRPQPAMGGILNVAIADFGQADDQGGVAPWPEGARLSRSIFERVRAEAAAEPGLRGVLEVRAEASRVEGRDADARLDAARRIAERIGADVLIYGSYDPSADPAFTPEFYVREGLLQDADEVLGVSQLGAPITVPSASGIGGDLILSDAMKARTAALAHLTVGLAYLVAGSPEQAQGAFERATQLPGWADGDGKEVAYLFLGTAARVAGAADATERARAYYTQAVRINPGYARGYIGLGNTWYDQFDATGRAQLDILDHAIAAYERADRAPFRPGGRVMEAKIAVSLGNGHLVRAQVAAAQAGEFDRAAAEYQPVVDWYEQGDDQLNDFAAQSLLGLGVIAERGRGDIQAAEALYRRSLAAASAGSIYQAQARAMLDAMSHEATGGLRPYMPLSSPATAVPATPTAIIPGRMEAMATPAP